MKYVTWKNKKVKNYTNREILNKLWFASVPFFGFITMIIIEIKSRYSDDKPFKIKEDKK